MMDNASGVLRGLNEVLGQNKDKLSNIISNLEKASENGNQLLVSVRENYVEGPQVKRIVNNLDKTLAATGANTDPLMKNVGGLVADARDVLGPEQREKLKSTIGDVAQLADKGNATMTDAQKIVGNMKRGEGTVGALLMDEEIYDDVQEMLRDLKHNPWKLFWRE
jgi:phospholipid/cholesterol/gamma-HCH transport system substrate-binding protein